MMRGLFKPKTKNLLLAMIATDFKIRYQSSVLGYFWSFIRPLSLFLILYVVYAKIFKIGAGIPHYSVYLLLGIMIWNFFAESTSAGLGSILERGELIRKVQIPRYTIVITAVSSAAINLVINLCIVFVFAIILGVNFNVYGLLYFPFLIIELILAALAVSFTLSILYVRYRDIKYIWELFLQIAFYATPIVYSISRIPNKYQAFLAVNPIYQIMQSLRYYFVTDQTITTWNTLGYIKGFIPIIVVCLVVGFSVFYFKKNIGSIAEEL